MYVCYATLPIMVKSGTKTRTLQLKRCFEEKEPEARRQGHVYQIFFVYNGTSVGHSKSSRYHAEVHMVTTLKEGLRSLKSDMGY